jgi:probable HAF family extracellular repeat protein
MWKPSIVFASVVLGLNVAAAQRYRATCLDIPGARQVIAVGAGGSYAGYALFPLDTEIYSSFQTDLANLSMVTAPAPWHDLRVLAMNSSGQMVGKAWNGQSTNEHAFLYSGGVYTDITPANSLWSHAVGINEQGQVAGNAQQPGAFSPVHAFIWENGVSTDLGLMGGSTGPSGYSYANAINSKGHVVGVATAKGSEAHAFCYRNGRFKDLGTFGGTYSVAHGINSGGAIVGAASYPNGEMRAFLFAGGVMKDLGTFRGVYSIANAINDHGAIVGMSIDSTGHPKAVICRQGKVINLNQVTEGLNGYVLQNAVSIDNQGRIVAYGKGFGLVRTFILKPI